MRERFFTLYMRKRNWDPSWDWQSGYSLLSSPPSTEGSDRVFWHVEDGPKENSTSENLGSVVFLRICISSRLSRFASGSVIGDNSQSVYSTPRKLYWCRVRDRWGWRILWDPLLTDRFGSVGEFGTLYYHFVNDNKIRWFKTLLNSPWYLLTMSSRL